MSTVNRLRKNKSSASRQSIRAARSSTINTTRGLPENTVYRDTGCDLAPSCLECPLALCKYDDPKGARRDRNVMRDTEILRLFAQGLKISTIALKVHISDRTVYRVLQRELGGAGNEFGRPSEPTFRVPVKRERVRVKRFGAWRQYSMPEVATAKAA